MKRLLRPIRDFLLRLRRRLSIDARRHDGYLAWLIVCLMVLIEWLRSIKRLGFAQSFRDLGFLKQRAMLQAELRSRLWSAKPLSLPARLYQRQRELSQLSDADRFRLREVAKSWPQPIRFSIVIPIYNTPTAWLQRLKRSLDTQIFSPKQIVLADDGSKNAETAEFLEQWARDDQRVLLLRLEHAGVARATQQGIEACTGDVVVFADHDDELTEEALWCLAEAFTNDPRAEVVFSDEEIVPEGFASYPVTKPDFSPENLLVCNYLCHLLAVRRETLFRVGGIREGTDGCQDYDLVLRLREGGAKFAGIQRILYRWHQPRQTLSRSLNPTSGESVATPGLTTMTMNVVSRHLAKRYPNAELEFADPWVRPVFPKRSTGSVSIIICTREVTARFESFLQREILPSIDSDLGDEVIVVVSGPKTSRRLRGVRYIELPGTTAEFSFAKANNHAGREATGRYLVLLNDDVSNLGPGWLLQLTGWLSCDEIGVVGAKLESPAGKLQHAGVAFSGLGNGPWHLHAGRRLDDPALAPWLNFPRNVVGVTAACMAISRELFQQLGGFNEAFRICFNDVDLCLRAREAGKRIVYSPLVTAQHDEGRTRGKGIDPTELLAFRERWPAPADPTAHPALTRFAGEERISPRRQCVGPNQRRWQVGFVQPACEESQALAEVLSKVQNVSLSKLHAEEIGSSLDVLVVSSSLPQLATITMRARNLGIPYLVSVTIDPRFTVPRQDQKSWHRCCRNAYAVVANNLVTYRFLEQNLVSANALLIENVPIQLHEKPHDAMVNEISLGWVNSLADKNDRAWFRSVWWSLSSAGAHVRWHLLSKAKPAIDSMDIRRGSIVFHEDASQLASHVNFLLMREPSLPRPIWGQETSAILLGGWEQWAGGLVEPGVNGVVIANRHPRSWSGAILALMEDSTKWRKLRLGQWARSRALAFAGNRNPEVEEWAKLVREAGEVSLRKQDSPRVPSAQAN